MAYAYYFFPFSFYLSSSSVAVIYYLLWSVMLSKLMKFALSLICFWLTMTGKVDFSPGSLHPSSSENFHFLMGYFLDLLAFLISLFFWRENLSLMILRAVSSRLISLRQSLMRISSHYFISYSSSFTVSSQINLSSNGCSVVFSSNETMSANAYLYFTCLDSSSTSQSTLTFSFLFPFSVSLFRLLFSSSSSLLSESPTFFRILFLFQFQCSSPWRFCSKLSKKDCVWLQNSSSFSSLRLTSDAKKNHLWLLVISPFLLQNPQNKHFQISNKLSSKVRWARIPQLLSTLWLPSSCKIASSFSNLICSLIS